MAKTRAKKNVDALLVALACGATVEQAARQAGITERTAYKRCAEPGFRRKLAKLREEIVCRTVGVLTAASLESVKTLLDLQKNSTPAVRLGAAKAVIEIAAKLREVVDLETTMLELEAKVEAIMQEKSGSTKSNTDDL